MKYMLSPREEEIAGLVTRGMSNKEIAKQLGIRHQTVRNTLSIVYRKISIHRRTQLAVSLILSDPRAIHSNSAATNFSEGCSRVRPLAAARFNYLPVNPADSFDVQEKD